MRVFTLLETQWRVISGMAGMVYQGLDYAAVESLLRLLQIKNRAKVFEGLRVMEGAALSVLNSNSK